MSLTRQGFLKATAIAGAALASGLGDNAFARTSRRGQVRRTLIRRVDLLSMDPAVGAPTDVDVLIEGDRIAAIGRNLAVSGEDVERIDARGMILMPGMIDGHRHVWEGISPGMVTKISTTSNYTVWKIKAMVCMTPEDAWFAQYLGGLQAINAGVTSVVDYCHAFHTPDLAEQAARGLLESGVAGVFCYQISHTPTYAPGDTLTLAQAMAERAQPADDMHWAIAVQLREKVFTGQDGIMKFGLAGSVGDERLMEEQVAELRRIRTLSPHLISQHLIRRPPAPGHWRTINQMQDEGLLGPDYHVAHGNGMTDEEMRLLRDTGGMVCATTQGEMNYVDPSIHGRARELGLPVGLGVDVPNAYTDDYFDIVRSAYYNLYRTPEGRRLASTYTGEDILDMATNMGARAMRHGDVTGSVTVGKRADLVLLATDRIGFPAFGTLADRVANFAALSDIDSVWVAGVARKRGGRMLGVDWAAIQSRLFETAERIEAQSRTITFTKPDGATL